MREECSYPRGGNSKVASQWGKKSGDLFDLRSLAVKKETPAGSHVDKRMVRGTGKKRDLAGIRNIKRKRHVNWKKVSTERGKARLSGPITASGGLHAESHQDWRRAVFRERKVSERSSKGERSNTNG